MKEQYKSIVFILLIVSYVILSSCKKDWLYVKPSLDVAVPSSLKDFQALLDDATVGVSYSMNRFGGSALPEIAGDGFLYTESAFAIVDANSKNAYTWSYQYPYTVSSGWIYLYARIYICNLVLEGLATTTPSTGEQEIWNNIRGQALFQRARNFLEATRIWAPSYHTASAATDLGIPLRTASDISIPVVRSTVQSTYNLILNDLQEAVSLLPAIPQYKTRGSKPAAFAILSRAYLDMENYTKAGIMADSCLHYHNSLINYNDLTVTSTNYPIGKLNNETIFYNEWLSTSNISNSRVDTSFYNLYDTTDKRKAVFFKIRTDKTISFYGNYTGNVILFAGIATDEIYLTRAECYARAGKIQEALDVLNALLIMRYNKNSFVPVTANSSDEALAKVLLERRKELFFRIGIRWADLRRLNNDPRFVITLRRTIAGTTYTLEPNSYKYTFPIPDEIIQKTGIAQNVGWFK